MSVYVHGLMRWPGSTRLWSHMIADSLEELHAMADRIGMKREWFQSGAKHTVDHYDVQARKRSAAIAAGAVDCSSRDTFVRHMRRIRGR